MTLVSVVIVAFMFIMVLGQVKWKREKWVLEIWLVKGGKEYVFAQADNTVRQRV